MVSQENGEPDEASDPLMSDDLGTLLGVFPSTVLGDIVEIIKQASSWSPFPAQRALEAHGVPKGADFTRHTKAIAREILWWGSNDIHRQFGEAREWREIVQRAADEIGVTKNQCGDQQPAWRMESSIFQKAFPNWERLSQLQREEAMRAPRRGMDSARGAVSMAAGILARLVAQKILPGLGAKGVGAAFAGTVFAPAATVLGGAWAAYDLAGPGYRVIRPVVIKIAYTRQRLRDERAAAAFRE